MAQASEIRAYTIRHINDAEGTEEIIPVYPTGLKCDTNIISKSWNNMFGEFQDIIVNSKLKVSWIYDCISESECFSLWRDLIYKKILQYKSRYFVINTYCTGLGYVKGTFYLGTPSSFTVIGGYRNDGSAEFYKGELHWIEVDGIRLNSPTIITPQQRVDYGGNK